MCICINTLHKGDNDDENNNNYYYLLYAKKIVNYYHKYGMKEDFLDSITYGRIAMRCA
jgi:hypothetical protein